MKGNFLVALLVILFFPGNVFAWGSLGHQVTGEIAECYLNDKARAEIRKLLGNESLGTAGYWADFIKSDRSYDYLNRWHYVNIRGGLSRREVMKALRDVTAANLYNKLNFLIRELKSKRLTGGEQVFYLKLLIHFIADAHQPMHMGQRNDRGGNNIKLFWFRKPTNLHRVWDEQLIAFQRMSVSRHVAAINLVSPAAKNKWMKSSVADWVYESYELARKLYKEVKPGDKLTYHYYYDHVNIINQQLLKGGLRLAAVLNDIFGG